MSLDTKKMRACAPLLPPPGDEVVCECLDEIERLEAEVEAKRALCVEAAPSVFEALEKMLALEGEVTRLRVLLDERHADLGAMTKHRDELLVRTMDPLRLVRAAKALESWLAGSHFTIGDPMTVAISVLEAADGDESDSRKATDAVGEN